MFALAFRNLFSHPAQNLFSALSVMIAMMLVIFVIAAQIQTQQRLEMLKGRNNMLVSSKTDDMPLSFKSQIEAMPGVKRVLYMWVDDATSSDKRTKFLFHATTAEYTTISDGWFYVPPDGVQRWESERTGGIVARNTAHDMNLNVGSTITLDTPAGPLPIVVSAISTRGYKNTGLLVHYDYFAELFKKQNRVNTFWVELQPGTDVKSVARAVDDGFKNTATPTISVSSTAFLKAWSKMGRVIPSLLTGAGLIILFTTLLVTASTIANGIRARIPELAMLRAIGFRRARILTLLLTEVLLVCLAGGAAGGVLPLLAFRHGIDMTSGLLLIGRVDIPVSSLGWVLLLSTGLGLAASLLPAWRASRADIATALRAHA